MVTGAAVVTRATALVGLSSDGVTDDVCDRLRLGDVDRVAAGGPGDGGADTTGHRRLSDRRDHALYDAEHALGGIVGYEVAETTDETPERVAVIQRLSAACLRTALHIDEGAWAAARAAFRDGGDAIGRADAK
jgi:hypothetical protein